VPIIFPDNHEERIINIRKLVAWNITLHGSRRILLEFGIGTPALIIFGTWLMSKTFSYALGLYVFLVGINFLVLLVYAIIIASWDSAEGEVNPDLARNKEFARKYGFQQLLILVPFAAPLITVIQEIRRLS
jgi:hypothetical protein